ncbi:MAG: UDP-N-acetylmuramoyl-L-alanyl-D-glutamate--2,6-diaminopimelate ligase [Candidatus Binataceae bacterium]
MRLDELLYGLDGRIEGNTAVEISGLSYDSRTVAAGHLFFSLARDPERRRANLNDALNRGTRAIVVGSGGGVDARPAVTVVESARPRLLMGAAAARFFGAPSERLDLIGITGTSGKTTTAYLLAAIFEAAGYPAGIIGTVGTFIGQNKIHSGLTTPESIDTESALSRMEREGVRHVAAEMSSMGIAEGRVDALNFRAAVFTNLGRDHLDDHGTLENYFAAKLRLFTEILPRSRRADTFAVVRGDDPYGERVLAAAPTRKVSFGLAPGLDVYPQDYDVSADGIRATMVALGKKIEFTSPLVGEFNLINILGASAVSVSLGIEPAAVAEGVRRCPGAPGRMEAVAARAGVLVLVDYAHKPDALAVVLGAARRFTRGRVICVFGCGGDRDRGKRPLMGAIAARLADVPIITSDNPRSEAPNAIVGEIEAGLREAMKEPGARAKDFSVEPDRRAAIALALKIAQPGDTVIVAGKGHENYQLVGDRVLAFDDRTVIGELVREHGYRTD